MSTIKQTSTKINTFNNKMITNVKAVQLTITIARHVVDIKLINNNSRFTVQNLQSSLPQKVSY